MRFWSGIPVVVPSLDVSRGKIIFVGLVADIRTSELIRFYI